MAGTIEAPAVSPGQQDLDGGEVPAPPVTEIRLGGNAPLTQFDLGGKKPTTASLTLTGGKVLLHEGQAFEKGTVLVLEVVAVVDDVGQKDKTDPKTQIVVGAEQKHKARITDVRIKEVSG